MTQKIKEQKKEETKKINATFQKKKIKNRKITNIEHQKNNNLTSKKQKNIQKIRFNKFLAIIKNKITKKNILYLVLLILDIAIIIYSARYNFANYISMGTKTIFVGETKNLLFGKNYISLITTIFFFSYICIINKFLFHQKINKKFVLSLLIFLLILNISLFYIFTKKVY